MRERERERERGEQKSAGVKKTSATQKGKVGVKGVFVAMPHAITRLVETWAKLLRVRELIPKFNQGRKRQPKG
jgi:hypothetical protein